MASTFFGLTIGESGLSTYQAAINTTANNIANVQTKGYSRQQVTIAAAESMRTYMKYGTLGTGVSANSIEQLRDQYYDMKYWQTNAKENNYETKEYYLDQIQIYFKDDETVDGFSSIFSKMYSALESLNTDAAEYSKRQTYVGTCQSLCTYFNNMATNLQELQTEINEVIKTNVSEINTLAQKIAEATDKINLIELTGENANELRDERALLIDQLSQYCDVDTEEKIASDITGLTTYKVYINGQLLVDTHEYRQLVCIERENLINQTDAEDLVDIYWQDATGQTTNTLFDPTISSADGSLKALFLLRDGNNKNYFNGTITSCDTSANTITISGTADEISQTSIDEMTIPIQGQMTIDSVYYNYTGFKLESDGTTYTYTFYLDDDTVLPADVSGSSMAIGESIDYMGIPYYQQQLTGFIREYAAQYNELQKSGQDLYGDDGVSFYVADLLTSTDDELYKTTYNTAKADAVTDMTTLIDCSAYDPTSNTAVSDYYYYQLTGLTVKVNDSMVSDANHVVTANYEEDSDYDFGETTTGNEIAIDEETGYVKDAEKSNLIDDLYDLCLKKTVFRNTTAASFLQCIISDVAVDMQEATTFKTNYENVLTSIESQRISVSGVDEDEEALDLVKYQNAYNLSSKLIQTLTEMYDKLIQETGV